MAKTKLGDGTLEIEITNWAKHNPKRAQKTYSWLRLNNDIATDPKLFGLSAQQRYAFVLLLCEVSKKNTGQVSLSLSFLSHLSGVSTDDIENMLDHLIEMQVIQILNAGSLHRTTPRISKRARRTTPTRRDETRRTDESSPSGDDSLERNESAHEPAPSLLPDPDGKLSKLFHEREVTHEHQQGWLDAFPNADWIAGEVRKAVVWESGHPERRKKIFHRFIAKWLLRGWDSRKIAVGAGTVDREAANARLDAWAKEQGLL